MGKIYAFLFVAAFSFAAQSYAAETDVSKVTAENKVNAEVSGDKYKPKDMQDKIIQMQNDMQQLRAKMPKITAPEEMQKVMREQMLMLQQCLLMMQIMQNHITDMEVPKQ